mmetsp:Transcript_27630/g.92447  ORF Transcript_27630/g.92447 Transcript_27630/m.92447 type:complete len:215 (+) Transcript_27630:241-885(+)
MAHPRRRPWSSSTRAVARAWCSSSSFSGAWTSGATRVPPRSSPARRGSACGTSALGQCSCSSWSSATPWASTSPPRPTCSPSAASRPSGRPSSAGPCWAARCPCAPRWRALLRSRGALWWALGSAWAGASGARDARAPSRRWAWPAPSARASSSAPSSPSSSRRQCARPTRKCFLRIWRAIWQPWLRASPWCRYCTTAARPWPPTWRGLSYGSA